MLDHFAATGATPAWLDFSVISVVPPDLRPMVQLDGERFATADLDEFIVELLTETIGCQD